MKTSMNDIEKAKEILNQYNQCHVASLFDKIDKAKQELFQLKLHFGNDDPYVNYLDVLLTTKK